MAPKCLGCSQYIPHGSNRRKLGSHATKQVIPVFKNLVERTYPGFRLQTRLEGEESYLCVPCFRRLEGVTRLRRQFADKEIQVVEHMATSVAGGILTLVEDLSNSFLRTPPRTSHANVGSITPRGGGRRRVSTSRRTITTGHQEHASLSFLAVC